MYLIFDTETNGKPQDNGAAMTDLDKWPRITELGWQLYDANEQLIHEASHLIYPDNWTIPLDKFFTDNGMNDARSYQFGVPIRQVLDEFHGIVNQAKYMVAHNMQFDQNVLGSECLRYGVKFANRPIKVCTMTQQAARPGRWPSLTDLHKYLFIEGFGGAHNALADVKACARIFFELKKNKHLKNFDYEL